MESHYIPIREVWQFEQYLASKPTVWRNEAINLRFSAEAIQLYDQEVLECIFKKRIRPRLPGFFSARVKRMLFGFSLENLVKAILLQNPEKLTRVFGRDGNLSWGNDGHDLLKLFAEAGIETSKLESAYLELWQLCSLWAGRYPLPVNEHHFPRQRKPMASHEALLKRSQKRIERAIAEGDELMGAEIYDLMHGGVGDRELEIFHQLFNRCDSMLPKEER